MDTRVTFFSEGVPVVGVLGAPGGPPPRERRPAIIVNHGLSGLKEMWLPEIAAKLEAAGYVTLRFDYRHFGESGGEARYRQVPLRQVEDVQTAVTDLEDDGSGAPQPSRVLGRPTRRRVAPDA